MLQQQTELHFVLKWVNDLVKPVYGSDVWHRSYLVNRWLRQTLHMRLCLRWSCSVTMWTNHTEISKSLFPPWLTLNHKPSGRVFILRRSIRPKIRQTTQTRWWKPDGGGGQHWSVSLQDIEVKTSLTQSYCVRVIHNMSLKNGRPNGTQRELLYLEASEKFSVCDSVWAWRFVPLRRDFPLNHLKTVFNVWNLHNWVETKITRRFDFSKQYFSVLLLLFFCLFS